MVVVPWERDDCGTVLLAAIVLELRFRLLELEETMSELERPVVPEEVRDWLLLLPLAIVVVLRLKLLGVAELARNEDRGAALNDGVD